MVVLHDTAMVSWVMLALGAPANIGAHDSRVFTSLCSDSNARGRLEKAGSLNEGLSIFRAQAAVWLRRVDPRCAAAIRRLRPPVHGHSASFTATER